MSTERTIYCDWTECDSNVRTATPPPYVPLGFYEVRTVEHGGEEYTWHFCCWPCVMLYAADQHAPEIIE